VLHAGERSLMLLDLLGFLVKVIFQKKKNYILITYILFEMGGFQSAGMGKNKKAMQNSHCKHFSLKGPKSENFQISYLLSEMDNFDYDCGLG